jgi:uncharacterized protein YjiS (DUF1127 family)
MTTYDTTRAMPRASLNIVGAAFAALKDWNDARVTRKALSRLSARELDDIGLCVGDIDLIAERRAR